MSTRACPFASKTVTEHVVRGGAAAALIVFAVWLAYVPGASATAGALAAGAGAVVLMRGCPTCWLMGLFATLAAHSRDRAALPQDERASATACLPASVPAPR